MRYPLSIQALSKAAPRGQGRLGLLLLAVLLASRGTLPAREFPPDVPPPKPVVLPTPAIQVLPNGLKVVVIERRSLPLVTLRLVVRSGAEADPAGLPGVGQLVAAMLNQGTQRRSAQQIAEAIDLVGGTIETGTGWDRSFAALTVLTDHTELAFDLLADITMHPAFASGELERKRKQTLSALEVMRDDSAYVAETAFHRLVLSGTPYGHPVDGTEDSVPRVTTRDLRDFHARHYRPSNCILAAVGDISAAEAIRLAETFFGTWAGGQGTPASRGTNASTSPTRVVVIDKPDAVQTEIRVGNLGIRRGSPDFYALTVANQILGGPAANRLFKALRSQKGLTYGASSELICNQTLGSWVAKTSTRTYETMETIQVVLEEMKRLRDRPVSDTELRTAQSYLLGHMALEFETSGNIAAQVLELIVHDLPAEYWNRFPEKVRALRTEDVLAATRRYLDPDHNVIVLVGNAGGFEAGLKKLGSARVIPLHNVDLASPTLERLAGAQRND